MRPSRLALCLFAVCMAGMPRAAGDAPEPTAAQAAAMAAKANALFPQIALERVDREGRVVVPPRLISQPKPDYPIIDRLIEKQGEVWVGFIVGPGGDVTDAKALTDSGPRMDKAALAGVRRWKFQPGTVDGRPGEFLLTVPVRFQLPRDSLKG